MNMDNYSIRKKLSVPLGFIALLVILVSVISISNSRVLIDNTRSLSQTYTEAMNLALNADRDLYQAHTAMLDLILATELGSNNTQQYLDTHAENAQQAKARLEQVFLLVPENQTISAMAPRFARDFSAWQDANRALFTLLDAGKARQAANLFNTQAVALFEALRENYDNVGEAIKALSDRTTTQSIDTGTRQISLLVAVVALALGACVVSIICVPRMLTRRLGRLTDMLNSISQGEGDLTQRLRVTGNDEITLLAGAFNQLMEKLQALIAEVKNDAGALAGSVNTLTESSGQAQNNSETQNSNLEQIATAVSQLSLAFQEVAENSQAALLDTQSADKESNTSKSAIQRSVSSIQDMEQTIGHASSVIQKLAAESKSITTLLNVIQDIAEQTNLLALNAAIEAARAGEQGRGFAVVADEVRTLASRTQQATADINQMVGNLEAGVSEAVSAIDGGARQMAVVTSLSQELTLTLEQVGSSVDSANNRIYQIAAATEEQSQVAGDINKNVTHLNTLSHQALTTVKAAREASQTIQQFFHSIEQNVGRFKV